MKFNFINHQVNIIRRVVNFTHPNFGMSKIKIHPKLGMLILDK